MHAREVILSLKWAAEGKLDVPIVGEYKIRSMAEAFGIKTKNRQLKNITIDLCDALLEDLSRTELVNTKQSQPAHRRNDRKYGKRWIFFQSVHTTKFLKHITPVDVQQAETGRVL